MFSQSVNGNLSHTQPQTPPLGMRHICGTGRQPTLMAPRCESTQGEVIEEGGAVLVDVGIHTPPTLARPGGTTPRARCNIHAIDQEDLAIDGVVGALLP